MPGPADLDRRENWFGGFYELELELGPRDDARLETALGSVWTSAGVAGCARIDSREHGRHEGVPLTIESLAAYGRLHGVVRLPSGAEVVCGILAHRDDEGGVDVLDFSLPLGALAATDARIGGFPFGPEGGPRSLAWREPIDAWLAAVALQVYAAVPFRLGLIGYEIDATFFPRDAAQRNGRAPEVRYGMYLVPAGRGLQVFPANR